MIRCSYFTDLDQREQSERSPAGDDVDRTKTKQILVSARARVAAVVAQG
jgi:hypothetical protein